MNNSIENKKITTLDELLDTKYGERGTEKRGKWEEGFEKFKICALLEEANGKTSECTRFNLVQ